MATLESLVDFYKGLEKVKVQLALSGQEVFGDQSFLRQREVEHADAQGFFNKSELYSERCRLLLGHLYDRLTAADSTTLSKVLNKVRDPLLDSTFIWLGSHGGLESMTREAFSEQFDARLRLDRRLLQTYLRPIILLDLVATKPQILSSLDQSSSYFPHTFFRERKPTVAQIEREIADVMLDLFSNELTQVLPSIGSIIPSEHKGKLSKYNGKFQIPDAMSIYFDKAISEKEIDKLYCNQEMKKDIVETLASCLQLVRKETWGAKKSFESLANARSPFRVSPTEYRFAMQTLEHYARNQILYVWQKTGEVIETHLSRLVGVYGKKGNDTLEIAQWKSKELCKKETSMVDSARYIPFCVRVLNRFYTGAKKLTENTATTL